MCDRQQTPNEARDAAYEAINTAVENPYSDLEHNAAHAAVDLAMQAEARAWSGVIADTTGFGFPESVEEAREWLARWGQYCADTAESSPTNLISKSPIGKQIFRCRECGALLDLHATQHGSHVVYEQTGVRECGPVDRWRPEMAETPMQSDQIVAIAQAVRLLAWHLEELHKYMDHDSEGRAEMKAVRNNMIELIETIKGPECRAERFGEDLERERS